MSIVSQEVYERIQAGAAKARLEHAREVPKSSSQDPPSPEPPSLVKQSRHPAFIAAKWIAVLFLGIALVADPDDEIYKLVRIVVFAAAATCIAEAIIRSSSQGVKTAWVIGFGFVAALFNPFDEFDFRDDTWKFLDFVGIVCFTAFLLPKISRNKLLNFVERACLVLTLQLGLVILLMIVLGVLGAKFVAVGPLVVFSFALGVPGAIWLFFTYAREDRQVKGLPTHIQTAYPFLEREQQRELLREYAKENPGTR